MVAGHLQSRRRSSLGNAIWLTRSTSESGQYATNRHVRVTSGFTPIADINLGQVVRQAARRPDQMGGI